jgi:hypothetical protein
MFAHWPDSGNGHAAKRLSRRLARQLAMHEGRTRNGRIGNLRDNSPQISTLTLKKHEYTNCINARSRRTAQSGSAIST